MPLLEQDPLLGTDDEASRAAMIRRLLSQQAAPQTLQPGQAAPPPGYLAAEQAPRMTGDVAVQRDGGPMVPVPSDQTLSLGAGAPTLLPTTGSERVSADPAWRQDWDRQQRMDQQNPFLQALGGTAYGREGAFPTLRQAMANNEQMTPAMYANLVGQAAQHRISTGDLGLRAVDLLGGQGQMGRQQRENALVQSQVDSNAGSRLHDQQNAADFQQFAQGMRAQGRTEDEIEYAWTHTQEGGTTGRRLPATRGGQPFQPAQPTVGALAPAAQTAANAGLWPAPAMPGAAAAPRGISPQEMAEARAELLARRPDLASRAGPVVNTNAPVDLLGGVRQSDAITNPQSATAALRPNGRPWSHIEARLNEASGYRTPGTPGVGANGLPQGATVGEFLNRLESNHPGTVGNNLDAIQSYISSRFGERALNDALARAGDSRQIAPPRNFIARLLGAPGAAATTLRQIVGGPTEEEEGLSGLGSLLRARQPARVLGAQPTTDEWQAMMNGAGGPGFSQ